MGESVARAAAVAALPVAHHADRVEEMVRPDERIVIACCLLVGVATVLLAPALGYDAWAWMVWARELTHFSLDTTGGPSWKPLPVLLSAPFAWVDGLAPFLWLALIRSAALYSVWLAARAAVRLSSAPALGSVAAAFAAFGLLVSTDLPRTALYGSSEPLLVVFVLAALLAYLADRPLWALAFIALGGLIRPELWPLSILYGLWCARLMPSRRAPIAALALCAPVIWVVFDWIGSGGLTQGAQTTLADHSADSAAGASIPALEVVARLGDAVIAPVLVMALIALVIAWRRGNRELLLVGGLAICWVGLVAVMAQFGFTGARRYLIGPAALLCVISGVGAASLLAMIGPRAVRALATAALALVFIGVGLLVLRSDARQLSVARLASKEFDQLSEAVVRAGGRDAVVRVGNPAVNPYGQTALAWQLDLPLSSVQGAWGSTSAKPNWRPPAVVFVAPQRLAGPRPAIGAGVVIRRLGSYGRWQLFRAYR